MFVKGKKMKNLIKKMVLVASAMAIAFGSATMAVGCKEKKSSPAAAPQKAPEKDKMPE